MRKKTPLQKHKEVEAAKKKVGLVLTENVILITQNFFEKYIYIFLILERGG